MVVMPRYLAIIYRRGMVEPISQAFTNAENFAEAVKHFAGTMELPKDADALRIIEHQ